MADRAPIWASPGRRLCGPRWCVGLSQLARGLDLVLQRLNSEFWQELRGRSSPGAWPGILTAVVETRDRSQAQTRPVNGEELCVCVCVCVRVCMGGH
jgi:hypothetical protein